MTSVYLRMANELIAGNDVTIPQEKAAAFVASSMRKAISREVQAIKRSGLPEIVNGKKYSCKYNSDGSISLRFSVPESSLSFIVNPAKTDMGDLENE